MLQFSSSPITPRPRPPRSRSSQLSSGSNLGATGTTTTPSMLTAATFVDEQLSKQLTSLVASAGPGSEIAPDTPPYTPELPLYEGHEREGPGDCHRAGEGEMQTMGTRTAKELEDMLAGAQRIIRDRERDLGIAASIGKTLLETNNALRAKQDALLARVQLHPTSAASPPRQRGLAVVSPPSAHYRDVKPLTASSIPFSLSASNGESVAKPPAGRSEYIETLPPPSPRSSLDGSQGRYRYREASSAASDSNDRDAWTDDELCGDTSIPPVALRRRQGLTGASPRASRLARRSHSRSSSISSAVLVIGPSANTSVTPSRSGSDRNLYHTSLTTPLLQLQQQHAALATQNAELERKLYELENELDQADTNGKRKLRRLDKELGHLQTELQAALERNRDLEDRLSRAKSSTGTATTASGSSYDSGLWAGKVIRASPEHDDAWLEDHLLQRTDDQPQPTTTDTDIDHFDIEAAGSGFDLPIRHMASASISRYASSPASLSRYGSMQPSQAQPNPEVVRQLLSEISELEATNASMASSREQLVARMQKASSEAQEIREQYEALEDRVLEAETRDRERAMLQIGLCSPDNKASPTSSLQRKAIGNRSTIERHRRLSSVYDLTQDLSPSSSPAKPERDNSLAPAARASRHGGLSRSVSAASSFFQSEDWEAREATRRAEAVGGEMDIFEAMKRGAAADQSLLRRSQHLLRIDRRPEEQEDTDAPEETSADWQRLYKLKLGLQSEPSVSTSEDDQSILHGLSPSNSLRVLGHGQHTLASELDGLWRGSTSSAATAVLQSRETPEKTTSGMALAIVHHAGNPSREQEAYDADHGLAMPAGPPNAESYDAMQASLCDLPITWADDEHHVSLPLLLKDVANHDGLGKTGAGQAKQTGSAGHHGSLNWVYDDTSDGSDENDPWREEEEARRRGASLAIESGRDINLREQADDKAARRRERLQELARAIAKDDTELGGQDAYIDSSAYLDKRLAALRTIGSDDELRKLDSGKQIQLIVQSSNTGLAPSSSSSSLTEYHQVSSDTRAPGSAGTDYWPVDLRARYAPAMLAMRIQTSSKEYLNLIVLWSRFLVVLAVAVAFSLWRGPKAALGLNVDGDAPSKRRQLVSQAASAPQERRLLTRPSRIHLSATSPGKEKQC